MSWRSPRQRYEIEPYRPEPPPRWMRVIALVVNLLVWPGVGQFVLGRFARGAFWIALTLACILAIPLALPYTLLGLVAPRLLSAIDAVLLRYHGPPTGNQLVLGTLTGLAGVSLVLFLTRSDYIEAFVIPSSGMSPTVLVGDHVFINKLEYRFGDMQRGDVVAFRHPCAPEETYMQRLVGLAGDRIEVRCDVLHVNGVAAPRQLLEERAVFFDLTDGRPWRERTASRLSEVLGDRRYQILNSPGNRRDFPEGDPPDCSALGDESAVDRPDPGRIVESAPAGGDCAPRRHYIVPDGHIFAMGDNRHHSSDSRIWGAIPVENVLGRAFGIGWSSGGPTREIRWDRLGDIE